MKKTPKPDMMMMPRIVMVVCTILLLAMIAFLWCRKEMFSSKPTLTYYYLPSCGWCTKFTPEWEKFVKMAPDTVVTNKVDGTTSPDIEKYKIKGFPHIQLVKGDGTVIVFEGERSAEKLMEFVQKYTKSGIIETFVVRKKQDCKKVTIELCMPIEAPQETNTQATQDTQATQATRATPDTVAAPMTVEEQKRLYYNQQPINSS
jgi:thioredoxin-like negative regulator of GroEL